MRPHGITRVRGRYVVTLHGRVLGTFTQMSPALAVYIRALKAKGS